MLLVASICSGYYKFVVKIKIAIALATEQLETQSFHF